MIPVLNVIHDACDVLSQRGQVYIAAEADGQHLEPQLMRWRPQQRPHVCRQLLNWHTSIQRWRRHVQAQATPHTDSLAGNIVEHSALQEL